MGYLHNFQRIRENLDSKELTIQKAMYIQLSTHHLTTAGHATSHQLPPHFDTSRFRIHRSRSDNIIYR